MPGPDWQQIANTIFGNIYDFVRGYDTAPYPQGHKGYDFSAPEGTPVKSLSSGKVVYAENASGDSSKASSNWATGGGNVVIVEDSSGVRYLYSHLSAIKVNVGQTVGYGTLLGNVGHTGDATGPHLHYAMINWNQRQWIDPTTFLVNLSEHVPSNNNILNLLDQYVRPYIGTGKTWSEGMTEIYNAHSGDAVFIGLYRLVSSSITATGIDPNAPISQEDFDKIRSYLSNDPEAGGVFPFVPDLTGVLTLLAVILVGIAFLVLAGLVSKVPVNRPAEA